MDVSDGDEAVRRGVVCLQGRIRVRVRVGVGAGRREKEAAADGEVDEGVDERGERIWDVFAGFILVVCHCYVEIGRAHV